MSLKLRILCLQIQCFLQLGLVYERHRSVLIVIFGNILELDDLIQLVIGFHILCRYAIVLLIKALKSHLGLGVEIGAEWPLVCGIRYVSDDA